MIIFLSLIKEAEALRRYTNCPRLHNQQTANRFLNYVITCIQFFLHHWTRQKKHLIYPSISVAAHHLTHGQNVTDKLMDKQCSGLALKASWIQVQVTYLSHLLEVSIQQIVINIPTSMRYASFGLGRRIIVSGDDNMDSKNNNNNDDKDTRCA